MAEQRSNFGTRRASAAPAAVAAGVPAAANPVARKGTGIFAPFEWMIALRYLRAKRKESFISVISVISLVGIALGVAVLIVVMSVMNGFRIELTGKILGFTGHVSVDGGVHGLRDFDAVAKRVQAVPGVVSVYPLVEGQALATANGASRGVQIRGVTRGDLKNMSVLSASLAPQALAEFGSGNAVIVGRGIAERLGLFPGAQITLTSPKGDITPFGTTPRVKSYTIAGTFDSGASEYNNAVIFMPLHEAQLYFDLPDAVSSLQIMVADPDAVDRMIAPIQKAAGPGVQVRTWHDLNLSLFNAVQVERNVMFLILSMIILVAALNVISGMVMLVKDKAGDIAILRTMGATRGAMMRIFLIAGASIGVMGTVAGLVLGLLFATFIDPIQMGISRLTGVNVFNPDIYFLTHMPSKIETGEVVAVVAMALVLSFLATLYPSWRAARLDPVEALRYE